MNHRIKQVRKEEGLSMASFGDKIGITAASICRLESGENHPSEQTIRAICNEFNIQREWLEFGKEPMRNNVTQLPPDLVRILCKYPSLQFAMKMFLDIMLPEELDELNTFIEKVLDRKNTKKTCEQ